MRSLASSQTNDLVFAPDGRLSVVDGLPAVEVVARAHMQTRRGEMVHAIQQGMPFDLVAWAGRPNLPQFEASARRRLLEVSGVREVVAFNARMDGDVLTYSATLRTDFGEVALNG